VFYPVFFLQALLWLAAVPRFFVLSKVSTFRSSSSHQFLYFSEGLLPVKLPYIIRSTVVENLLIITGC
jgi:hypothetical protein